MITYRLKDVSSPRGARDLTRSQPAPDPRSGKKSCSEQDY